MNPHGRPVQAPHRIIIHAMAEYLTHESHTYHAKEFLEIIGLSAHILIAPDGANLRCREDTQGAYHAKRHNKDSLGIEYLVPGVHNYTTFLEAIKTPYVTHDAYTSGLKQIRGWIEEWEIKTILRHSDIDPDRKVDPGQGFQFSQLLEDLG